jgi:hypothetical protein
LSDDASFCEKCVQIFTTYSFVLSVQSLVFSVLSTVALSAGSNWSSNIGQQSVRIKLYPWFYSVCYTGTFNKATEKMCSYVTTIHKMRCCFFLTSFPLALLILMDEMIVKYDKIKERGVHDSMQYNLCTN